MRPCVFLDRDGVINRPPPPGEYLRNWEEFEFLPRIVDWIKLFRALGCLVIVVTNQRGVALGRVSARELETLHQKMREALESQSAPIDAIYCCPHEEGQCDCRKPAPGLIREALRDFPIDLSHSILIGDSDRDKNLAERCGIHFVLVHGGRMISVSGPPQPPEAGSAPI